MEPNPTLVPVQYVCTFLLACGNDGVAASFTHHTELVSMSVFAWQPYTAVSK